MTAQFQNWSKPCYSDQTQAPVLSSTTSLAGPKTVANLWNFANSKVYFKVVLHISDTFSAVRSLGGQQYTDFNWEKETAIRSYSGGYM